MSTRFEIVLADDGSYVFQLRSNAGELLLKGPHCPSKIMTQNGILHLRRALQHPELMEAHTNADGSSFIVVRDQDGSALARSRRAASDTVREDLERSLCEAAGAPMIDLTKHRSAG